ncbi:MAG: hypothetical protein KF718_19815 [Polyangiaceae bacterium]|nr:hypothetical protein [Polyangiaceae bacterium]
MARTDPTLEQLWKKVVDDWDNDKAHALFLEHCRATGALAEAAARYRGMAGDRERGPTADKRLSAVLALALAQLETLRSSEPQRTSGRGLLWILLFVSGILAVLAYLGARGG